MQAASELSSLFKKGLALWKQDDADAGPCHFHRGFEGRLGLVKEDGIYRVRGKERQVLLFGTGLQACGFGRSKASRL